ncbi:MAG: Ig-like domain-containing protein, partial [Chitinophagales bacterium]|nr:Ig-like domain-containing protein [Chitinophagales bacterium]
MKTNSTYSSREKINDSFFVRRSVIESLKHTGNKPIAANLQAVTSNRQPVTDNLQPATVNLQPVTCNRHSATLNHSTFFMKKFLRRSGVFAIALLIVSLFLGNNVLGQAASGTWALTANGNAAVSGNVSATSLLGGSGIGTISYGTNGAQSNGWTTGGSRSSNDYYQYTISPTGSNVLTVTQIQLQHARTNNSGGDGGPTGGAVYYSLDGFNSENQVASNFSVGTSIGSFSQSGLSITVLPGQTLTIRVFGWGAENSSGLFYNRNVIISGSTAALASPITITSNYNFTVPAGVSCLKVEAWGGGGNGSNGGSNGGSGGGSGAYVVHNSFSTSGITSLSITIGQGGGGSSTRNTVIKNGSTTLFSAAGGNGSTAGTATSSSVPTGGTKVNGGNGSSNSGRTGGDGGDAPNGSIAGGTGGAGGSSGDDGENGNPFGGGGGGGGRYSSGGTGANGGVIITWVDASDFNVSSNSPICSGSNAIITLTSTTINDGTYDINYSTTNPASSLNTSVTFTGGTATFSVSGLTGTPSPSAVTINWIAFSGASCNTTLTGKSTNVTVNSVNTFGSPSSTPTLCQNILLTPITIATTGATGIGSSSGLPNGVSASWAADVITISGTPTNSGTFNYSIPLTGGCGTVSAIGTITVLAAPTPTFTTSPAANICINSSVTYTTQSGQSNYLWSVPGTENVDYIITSGGIGNTDNSVTLTWLTTGSKTVTVNYTDANGCAGVNAASSNTMVNAYPNASFSYSSPQNGNTNMFCQNLPSNPNIGSNLNPSPVFSGTTGGTFTSSPSGLVFADANPTSNTGQVDLAASAPGTYTVTYTVTTNGCTTQATAQIIIVALPTATLSYPLNPTAASYCKTDADQSPILTNTSGNNYTLVPGTYSEPTGNLDIDASTGVIKPSSAQTHPGTYTITYTFYAFITGLPSGTTTCPNTITTTVTILASPSITTQPTAPAAVCENNGVATISITATGDGLSYQWQVSTDGGSTFNDINDGGVYSNSSTNSLTITNASLSMNGYQYHCVVSGTCSPSVTSDAVALTVNATNTVSAASSSPTVCNNIGLVNITHNTTGATGIGTATGLPAGVTASWSSNVITISGTPTQSGTFNYSIPLTGGCGALNATGTIEVTAAPVISMSQSYICLGSSAQILTPTSGGTWTSSNPSVATVANDGTVTAVAAGTVTFTFHDNTSGCESTTAALTVDASCQVVTLTQPAQLAAVIAANGPLTICAGQSSSITVTVSGGSGSYDVAVDGNHKTGAGPVFTFNVSPTTTTTYSQSNVVVKDVPNNCNSNTTGTVQIIVNPVTAISNGPTGYSICLGGTIADLSVTASGTGTLHYEWYSNTTNSNSGGTAVGSDQSTYTPTFDNNVPGVYYYYVTVTGDCGSATSAVAAITVNPLPNNTGTGFSGGSICIGDDGKLTFDAVDAVFNGPYTIQYTDGTTTWSQVINNASATQFNVAVNPTSTTTYTLVSITDGNGCVRTSGFGKETAQILVRQLPVATLTTQTNILCHGGTNGAIDIDVTGGNSPYTYLWTASNGGVLPSGQEIVQDPSGLTAGTYTVVVTSQYGCASAPLVVTISEPDVISSNAVVTSDYNGSQLSC